MVVRSEEKLESLQYRAHELLGTVCDDFLTQRPGLPLSDMVSLLDKYIMKKSPIEATNERLEEIKITLHQTIVSVLGRGEKIEDLQARTKKLSTISKTFYTQVAEFSFIIRVSSLHTILRQRNVTHVALSCKWNFRAQSINITLVIRLPWRGAEDGICSYKKKSSKMGFASSRLFNNVWLILLISVSVGCMIRRRRGAFQLNPF